MEFIEIPRDGRSLTYAAARIFESTAYVHAGTSFQCRRFLGRGAANRFSSDVSKIRENGYVSAIRPTRGRFPFGDYFRRVTRAISTFQDSFLWKNVSTVRCYSPGFVVSRLPLWKFGSWEADVSTRCEVWSSWSWELASNWNFTLFSFHRRIHYSKTPRNLLFRQFSPSQ